MCQTSQWQVTHSSSLQLGELQTDAELKERVAGEHGTDEGAIVLETSVHFLEQLRQVVDPVETLKSTRVTRCLRWSIMARQFEGLT